jgi:UDP-N-acetyl-D-galactosamine dehydrogenase
MNSNEHKIAIIGLGYVGLPLAVEFGKKYFTVGFDINEKRVNEISNYIDNTLEIDSSVLNSVIKESLIGIDREIGLYCSTNINDMLDCNVYIITVPTPINKYNQPDLQPLYKACESVGKVIKKENIVIFESTVYPGVTEEECVPVIEKKSGLKFNKDFFVGYSPERINPGDKTHTLTKILKITSGSTPQSANTIDNLYKSIITAGTYKASSIKVAEAAKVIENSQRDINIAFVNELAKIFSLLGIDTSEVLAAAGTKWNFLKFQPGLVGGHCIGVDPYYLAQKAQEMGYHPEIILSGRRVNDSMPLHVANEVIKMMIKREIEIKKSDVLILGFTFKENCPDIRNTKVVGIVKELAQFSESVTVWDPWVDSKEAKMEYDLDIVNEYKAIENRKFDILILAVGHNQFINLDFKKLRKQNSIIYDLKSVLPKSSVDARL